ncbi:hypothetical protein EVAR_25204_1 [Eumeta japonica]|uniref:Uncharacterized protein n=1 Tax=Eumeta variegata TaxID=151549 RepID=A0A4C1WK27_EUMVA|nr:hypothetical protein EVAR_25204_1 [Eumeta japonica]
MTKSLTTSIQQAVNTVRDLTHIDQTVPFITSVLEPIASLTKDWDPDRDRVPKGEECFELPPIKDLPSDISDKVLESIINEFKDVNDQEAIRKSRSEELEKKLKLYNSIMAKQCEGELIHSRRSRRRDSPASRPSSASRPGTPARGVTPAPPAYTSPCLMTVSVNVADNSDDKTLEKQIEEKEKILAKMLNLESLSISSVLDRPEQDIPDSTSSSNADHLLYNIGRVQTPPTPERTFGSTETSSPRKLNGIQSKSAARLPDMLQVKVKSSEIDFVPKLAKVPNNWHLENLELQMDEQSGGPAPQPVSPGDHLDSEWEII